MKVKRTHDELYLYEDRRNKEYFKLIYDMIGAEFKESFKVCDVGAATGDFLYFLKKRYPNAMLTAMDVMPSLLEKIDFVDEKYVVDITDIATLPSKKYDCVTFLGVMGIFDDFKPAINGLVTLLNEGGCGFIFGIFNKYDLDVLVKSRRANDASNVWESGWNVFSLTSIERYLNAIGYRTTVIPFTIGIDIDKHNDDPLRSWTVKMINGERIIINGLGLIHDFYIIKFKKIQ